MRGALCCLFFFIVLGNAIAQREASFWYFGSNAGIRFNPNGTVTTLTDGALDTLEGCAAISDRFGNLLFYTDGITVFNRNHQVMDGGEGLLGDPSSSQSAIIVPKPDSNSIYYIFTVAALEPGETPTDDIDKLQGLNYYVVDMESGDDGAVIEHGNNGEPLLIPNFEKITAVRSADCNSIWVITHFRDTFYAFDVSAAGVNATPVTSQVGIDVPFPVHRRNAIGYLKASPDGSKLGIAHSNVSSELNTDAPGALLLYDFDTATGEVSNEVNLDITMGRPYGVEFSANSSLFYATVTIDDTEQVVQYDLESPDISSSRIQVGLGGSGALQLAANGKIYHAPFTTSLSVIEFPNIAGVGCNYQSGVIPLAGRSSNFGLPPFIQSLFNEVVDITGLVNDEGLPLDQVTLCANDDFTFEVQEVIPGATYTWYFDDGETEVLLPCTGFQCAVQNINIADDGLYRVEVDPMNGDCPLEGFGFLTVIDLPDDATQVLIQCDVDLADSMDGITTFNLEQAIEGFVDGQSDVVVRFFENQIDVDEDTPITTLIGYRNTVPFTQDLIVEISAASGCETFATLTLEVRSTINSFPEAGTVYTCNINPNPDEEARGFFDLEEIRDDFFPEGAEIVFYLTPEDAVLETNPIPYGVYRVPTMTIYGRLENNNQCRRIARFELVVDESPTVEFPEAFLICLNQSPELLTAPDGFDTYTWIRNGQTVSETDTLLLEQAGTYVLEVGFTYEDDGVERSCTASVTFEATVSNTATIESIEVSDLSENNTLSITVRGEGDYEYSITSPAGPYQDAPFFENVEAGIVTVYVRDRNGCGYVVQEVAVIGIPKFFTPNGDGINDFWRIKGNNRSFPTVKEVIIFDRFGKLLAVVDPFGAGWDGIYNGNPLPVNGYWYQVVLVDGRIFKGAFSLIRRG